MASKSLKNGAKGSEVKALQKGLNTAGAKPKLNEDGKFGDITEEAVKAFRKQAELMVPMTDKDLDMYGKASGYVVEIKA